MANTIKNMNDLSKALKPKIENILNLVAEDVKTEIDDKLNEYYKEYSPIHYARTNQLRNCCKIGEIKKNGNKISVEVFLDIKSLHYITKGSDPYKTVVSANSGLHGGYDPDHIDYGQVPWSTIKNNDGTKYGSGTRIWSEPMEELFDNGKLIELFKKSAKKYGLEIK